MAIFQSGQENYLRASFSEPMVSVSESTLVSIENADKQHVLTFRGCAVTCTEASRARVPPWGEVGPAVEGCEGGARGIMGARGAGKSGGVSGVGGGGRREAQRSGEGVGKGGKGSRTGRSVKAALSGSPCKS